MKHSHTYDLTDSLLFGKYRGYALQTILLRDPTYILWCLKKIDKFQMSDYAWNYAMSRDKTFAHFKPTTQKKGNNLIEKQRSDGVDVLTHYPWKDKQRFRRCFMGYVRAIAEDIVESHSVGVQYTLAACQLELQFV